MTGVLVSGVVGSGSQSTIVPPCRRHWTEELPVPIWVDGGLEKVLPAFLERLSAV